MTVSNSCLAGRPLAVDDANVNDPGSGHVEMFYQRGLGGSNSWTIAPAYGVVDGVELAASFNRDATAEVSTSSIQAKFRLTPSRKDACNLGTSLGVSQPDTSGVGSSQFINGLVSCSLGGADSVHLNLGVVRPPIGSNVGNWGIAWEHEFQAFTGHLEAFGQENSQPTVQAGLRTMVSKRIQIDGTVATSSGESLYSLGLKFLF